MKLDSKPLPSQTISIGKYVDLRQAVKEALPEEHIDAFILPGGVLDRLDDFLTCKKCGKYVCYKHNPGLEPLWGQTGICLPVDNHNWSKPINERALERFKDTLIVTLEE